MTVRSFLLSILLLLIACKVGASDGEDLYNEDGISDNSEEADEEESESTLGLVIDEEPYED